MKMQLEQMLISMVPFYGNLVPYYGTDSTIPYGTILQYGAVWTMVPYGPYYGTVWTILRYHKHSTVPYGTLLWYRSMVVPYAYGTVVCMVLRHGTIQYDLYFNGTRSTRELHAPSPPSAAHALLELEMDY